MKVATKFIGGIVLVTSCAMGQSAMAADTAVVTWDKATLQAIRVTHPGPPIVARALAIAHTCMYDAWAAYDDQAIGTRFKDKLRRPSSERNDANKNKAISYAAYKALIDLFPTEKVSFDALMSSLGYSPLENTTDTKTSAGIGNVACQAVIDFRHADGANQLGDLNGGAPYSDYTGYTPVNTPDIISDPNHWQPLRVGTKVQKFITPQWREVTPFALKSASQFRPLAPEQYGSYGYLEQARQVLAYSASLNDEQKVIAEYWADGPSSELPPGHWALFAQFVSQRDLHTVDQDAKMFFAMTNAIFDASIVSWEAKRYYDSVRPVTAIHYLFNGKMVSAWAGPGLGTKLIPAETWRPYQPTSVVTPPFPEYISGHSIFSAAGATVLRLFTGSDVFGHSVTIPKGTSQVEPGLTPTNDVTLTWANFSDAANEAGISRRYGGIHFIEGDLVSREIGDVVGFNAYKKALKYFKNDQENNNDD